MTGVIHCTREGKELCARRKIRALFRCSSIPSYTPCISSRQENYIFCLRAWKIALWSKENYQMNQKETTSIAIRLTKFRLTSWWVRKFWEFFCRVLTSMLFLCVLSWFICVWMSLVCKILRYFVTKEKSLIKEQRCQELKITITTTATATATATTITNVSRRTKLTATLRMNTAFGKNKVDTGNLF